MEEDSAVYVAKMIDSIMPIPNCKRTITIRSTIIKSLQGVVSLHILDLGNTEIET